MITAINNFLRTTTVSLNGDSLPATTARKTRRVYDLLSGVYPVSTWFFHSRAHRCAMEMSGIRDGMRVLEVATGSGEMFRRLVRANPRGATVGLDISPKMAARAQRTIRRDFPRASAHCQAVDARWLPFRESSFDAVVCCYLLELLSGDDILAVLLEMHRVMRPAATLSLVCIGQETRLFNRVYKAAGSVAPAFWGRQIERRAPDMIAAAGFTVLSDRVVRQTGYPSRVISAVK